MNESEVDVVNIAALDTLGVEVDIEQIVDDVDLPVANFDPGYNAAFFRFTRRANRCRPRTMRICSSPDQRFKLLDDAVGKSAL